MERVPSSTETGLSGRRETSWSAWCEDVLEVAALPSALVRRAGLFLSSLAPDDRLAAELSSAYATRTAASARAALRTALRVFVDGRAGTTPQVANKSALVAMELLALEADAAERTLASIGEHGIDADPVRWDASGVTLRERDGLLETHALLNWLIEQPAVLPDVRAAAVALIDGELQRSRLAQELRRLSQLVDASGDIRGRGEAGVEAASAPTARSEAATTSMEALVSLTAEVRALRVEVGRRTAPYDTTHDWVEDVVSALPQLLDQNEAAQALKVTPRTIRRMISRGELKSVDVGSGGRGRSCGVRIARAEVAALLRRKTEGRSSSS